MLALLAGSCSPGEQDQAASQEEYQAAAAAVWDELEGFATQIADCARAQGFEPNIGWDLGFRAPEGLAGAQLDQYWEVIHGCMEEITPEQMTLSAEEVARRYRLLLAAAECLEAEGFRVPERTVSAEGYVSAVQSGSGPSWNAYEFVMRDEDTFRAASAACPHPGG